MTDSAEGARPLTPEEKRVIGYYLTERSIDRWCGWPSRKEAVRKEWPHLVEAIERAEIAQMTLSAIVKSLQDEFGRD